MATNVPAGESELMGFLKGVYVYEPKGIKKPWVQFWMNLSGRGFFGRMATRLAEWGVPPYQGRFYLSRLTPKGYISPRAVIYHKDLHMGAHSFVGDNVIIFQKEGGGPVILGRNVLLKHDIIINTAGGGQLILDDNADIQHHCIFAVCLSPVEIGKNVMIGSFCSFFNYDHGMDPGEPMAAQPVSTRGGIFVEDDVWLGVGVTVLDGVRIGHGAVVAAGSVVTKDIPPWAIAAGSPAKVVKMRREPSE